MQPKINYHYSIPFKEVDSFEFKAYNPIVDETCYKYRIGTYLPNVIELLKDCPDSRQALITTHNNYNNACLSSLHFQIVNKKLIVIANFRSQCKVNGRPYDTLMLQYISTKTMQALGLKHYKVYVNVGNYHINESLT